MPLRFASYRTGGPAPKFSLYHIWKAYTVIDRKGPVGRKALSQNLRIGEGSTRTILDKMIKDGMVENTRRGAVLTQKGKKLLRNSGLEVRSMDPMSIAVSKVNCAVHLKDMAHRILLGCEQRDEAVRAGASGATTIIFRDGHFYFPGDCDPLDDDLTAPIHKTFDIEENDVVIIGSALTYEAAEKGAVTAALSLIEQSSIVWSEGPEIISSNSDSEELKSLALAIHELLGRLPVSMRTKNHFGVRVEDGMIIDANYTGPVLEEALRKNRIIRKTPPSGAFQGVPVVAVPITRDSEAIAAIAVIDITKGAVFDLIHRLRRE